MSIRIWVFGLAWAIMAGVNAGVQYGVTQGFLTISVMMFVLTLADAILECRVKTEVDRA